MEPETPNNYCPEECPNRYPKQRAKYIDKGFSYLSALFFTGFLGVIAWGYDRRNENIPEFILIPGMTLVAIALFCPTEQVAELMGKFLSLKITVKDDY